jgi:hypothetical protein
MIVGRLTVLAKGTQKTFPSGARQPQWLCRCECGSEVEIVAASLDRGKVKSCGCLYSETRGRQSLTHGRSASSEYRAWQSMKARCYNPKARRYECYGGRGIRVCDRWLYGEGGRTGAECFLADMGMKPSPSHTMDRRENDGDYEPRNCRWATYSQQNANRRSYTRRARA